MFRNFKPGYAPGVPDDAEILWFTTVLEQFFEVSPTPGFLNSSTLRHTANGFETAVSQTRPTRPSPGVS